MLEIDFNHSKPTKTFFYKKLNRKISIFKIQGSQGTSDAHAWDMSAPL